MMTMMMMVMMVMMMLLVTTTMSMTLPAGGYIIKQRPSDTAGQCRSRVLGQAQPRRVYAASGAERALAQGLNNPSLRLMVEEKGFTIARSVASYTRELKIKSGCLSAKNLDDPSVYECPGSVLVLQVGLLVWSTQIIGESPAMIPRRSCIPNIQSFHDHRAKAGRFRIVRIRSVRACVCSRLVVIMTKVAETSRRVWGTSGT